VRGWNVYWHVKTFPKHSHSLRLSLPLSLWLVLCVSVLFGLIKFINNKVDYITEASEERRADFFPFCFNVNLEVKPPTKCARGGGKEQQA
jgi:hypothetical protein